MTTISVLSLSYNDEQCIDMYLDGALTVADEIIILDGGSTDLTVPIIKQFQEKYPEKIKLIHGLNVCPEAYEKQIKDQYGRVLQNGHFGQMRQYLYSQATSDFVFWIDLD